MLIINENLSAMLEELVLIDGSDLHLSAGEIPRFRVNGKLAELADEVKRDQYPVPNPALIETMLKSVLSDSEWATLNNHKSHDFSFGIEGLARFRVNAHYRENGLGAVFRVIPAKIRSFDDLGLPPTAQRFCDLPRGLILVTGPTGSGKSTTLAAMIDKINAERHDHILTIEDPIEFLHKSRKSLVTQREVGAHTKSFADALREGLRQDPDVVLVGEMRDRETIEAAITCAETGHLTFGTLHTSSASTTINRIIDAFPANQQAQIKAQLSVALEGVMSQTLIPRKDGQGRAMALEILVANNGVRNLIREGKTEQIYSLIQSGYQSDGMQSLEMSLAALVTSGTISKEKAAEKSSYKEELSSLIEKGGGPLTRSARSMGGFTRN